MYRKNNASLLYKKSDDNMSGHARMKDKEKLIKNKKNEEFGFMQTVIE